MIPPIEPRGFPREVPREENNGDDFKQNVEALQESMFHEADTDVQKLADLLESLIASPDTDEEAKIEARAILAEAHHARTGFTEATNLFLRRAGELIKVDQRIAWWAEEDIHEFDPDLVPIRQLHSGYNRVYLCHHPTHGKVVLKIPSNIQERTLLANSRDIDNVVHVSEISPSDPKKRGLVTEYIDGATLHDIMNQTPPWEYKEGNILYDGKALTDAESIKRKLSVALEKLHALKRSGFDIRPINVLISKENGEPYLFDFDLQFGGRRDIDIGEVAEQMLFLPATAPIKMLYAILVNPEKFLSWRSFVGEILAPSEIQKYLKRKRDFVAADREDVDELFSRHGIDAIGQSSSLWMHLMNLPPSSARWT